MESINESCINDADEYAALAQDVMKTYEEMAVKAAVSVNRDTLQMYWSLGEKISSEDTVRRHGTHYIGVAARRLKAELPDRDCFTTTSLGYMRRFYMLYRGVEPEELEALFCLPWSYHKSIIDRCTGDPDKALYYAALALATGMSRDALKTRMDLSFFESAGRPGTELKFRLPEYGSELCNELMLDLADALPSGRRMAKKAREPLKKSLTRFFLYKGLAYIGTDVSARVGERHVCLDLVMYIREMRRSLIVEFVAEAVSSADRETILLHAAALDETRAEGEGETIGLLICRAEDGIYARYVCRTPDILAALPAEEAIEAYLA
ncbi:MAG: PDDEXK nuclease domain-containing protein [Clostridia bacterium]|nr:PDDEXK nuclease domain-containing protein [Clostridia bacterium]